MKKIIMLFMVFFVFVSFARADDGAGKWILLGADAAVAGLAVFALMDQINAAEEYERIAGEIDGSTEAGYYRLLFEREKVVGKENMVVVSTAALGVMLLYTAADYFWLHRFFPADIDADVTALPDGIKLTLNGMF